MGPLTYGYRETGHRSRTQTSSPRVQHTNLIGQHVFRDHDCNKVLTVDSLQPFKHDFTSDQKLL